MTGLQPAHKQHFVNKNYALIKSLHFVSIYTCVFVRVGHQSNMEELSENIDFSHVRILKMMYAGDPTVRLTAGAALAAFAYNSLNNQKVRLVSHIIIIQHYRNYIYEVLMITPLNNVILAISTSRKA